MTRRNAQPPHRWTLADDACVRQSYAQGRPLAEIAAELGVTLRAVMGRGQTLGLRHRSRERTLAERFWDNVREDPQSDCLLWIGARGVAGVGIINDGGDSRLATHVALELHGIATPGMLSPDHGAVHACGNRLCVNVNHLSLWTALDRILHGRATGRLAQQRRMPLSEMPHLLRGELVPYQECLRGHALAERNLYIAADGTRVCRACRNLNARRARARAYR